MNSKTCITLFFVAILCSRAVDGFTAGDETLLRSTIFSGYDNEVRPEAVTHVILHFSPTSMNAIDIKTATMEITGWWTMTWNDSRLSWDPSLYDDIGETHVYQDEIWTPPIIVYNSIDNLSALNENTIPLRISSLGTILWSPPGILTVSCSTDISYFPFDTQTCSIQITTFGYTIAELSLEPGNVDTSFYSPNGEWIMEKTYTETNPSNEYSFVTYSFQYKRKPAYYGLNLILPVMMCWLLSVFIFLLPAESGEKMGYSLTVLLAFVVLMTLLADTMPTTADHVSLLEVYIILVLTFCGLSVAYSIISLSLYFHREDVPVPAYLVRFTHWVDRHSCRRKVKVDDDPIGENAKPKLSTNMSKGDKWADRQSPTPESDDSRSDKKMTWREVAYAMDSVVMKVYFVVTTLFTIIFLSVMGGHY